MLRFNKILFFIFVILYTNITFSQVSTNEKKYQKYYYKNGNISSEGYMLNNVPDGIWKTYYENSKLKSVGKRTNLKLDSIWVFYNEDGSISKKIQYLQGQKNGYTETYHNINDSVKNILLSKELYLDNLLNGTSYIYDDNSKLTKIIKYVDGKKHGLSKDFSADSTVITTYEYYKGYYLKREKINRINTNNKKDGLWKNYYPNDNVKMEAYYQNGELNGFYREFDTRGKIIVEIKYENGQEITETEQEIQNIDYREKLDKNDNVIYSGTYKDSLPIGIHREFDSKGKITNAWIYNEKGIILGEGIVDKKGKKQGEWSFFYENGDVKSKGEFKNDKEIGNWKYFFSGGLIEQKGRYIKGKPDGLWEWFYASGKKRRTGNFYKGKEDGLSIEYSEDGTIMSNGEYSDGEKTGFWTYNVGDYTEKGNYKFGLKDGIWKHYYATQILQFKGLFIQGAANGKHIYYYPNGKILETQNYLMGSREGRWKRYDKNGQLIITITYKNDVEIKIDGGKIKPPHNKKIK